MPTLVNPASATADTRPAYEVGDVFRQHGDAYRQSHALPV